MGGKLVAMVCFPAHMAYILAYNSLRCNPCNGCGIDNAATSELCKPAHRRPSNIQTPPSPSTVWISPPSSRSRASPACRATRTAAATRECLPEPWWRRVIEPPLGVVEHRRPVTAIGRLEATEVVEVEPTRTAPSGDAAAGAWGSDLRSSFAGALFLSTTGTGGQGVGRTLG